MKWSSRTSIETNCDVEGTSNDDNEDVEENEGTGVVIITEVNANKAFVAHEILALISWKLYTCTIITNRNSLLCSTKLKYNATSNDIHIFFFISFAVQYYESDRNTDSPWRE